MFLTFHNYSLLYKPGIPEDYFIIEVSHYRRYVSTS